MRRCDYQDSWCIYSHSNILYVHFQTDGSVSYPGFTAFYEKVSKRYAVCKVNSSKATFSLAFIRMSDGDLSKNYAKQYR